MNKVSYSRKQQEGTIGHTYINRHIHYNTLKIHTCIATYIEVKPLADVIIMVMLHTVCDYVCVYECVSVVTIRRSRRNKYQLFMSHIVAGISSAP